MDFATSRSAFQPPQSTSLARVAASVYGLGTRAVAGQGLDETIQRQRPLLAAQTIGDLFVVTRQRDDLIQALTPDNLKGAALPGATAATLDSAPYPSGQHSAYNNVNGAFSETLTTPPTRVSLSTTSA